MTILKLSEAKAHLGRYVRRAARGERFIVADRNQPMAKLVLLDDEAAGVVPKIGLMDGAAKIPDDFNAPLESFETDFYGK